MRRIDDKHHLDGERIIKTGNGGVIDLDIEPVMLFRGRDRLALPMIQHYRALCVADGVTDYQLEGVDDMIRRFAEFAASSPTMKQPGITRGL